MSHRWIFHIDINHCYAQIEEMRHPELRKVPMAVGGHEEKRHGIILTKNDLAKKYGVRTGESLREAKEKCPDLLIVPPDYKAYIYYTGEVKKIYYEYSDHVESFGMDEAWIDYTDSMTLFGDPVKTAAEIQKRILEELGLTVSVGVSWNKVFAKLGSDMKKPYGFTVITPDNYQDLVWPLPVGDLLYVGPATQRKLHERGILTIGDLARYPVSHLKKAMGVSGEMIHAFANGRDPSPVQETDYRAPVRSVGNSMTMIHDVDSMEELKPVLYVLSEAVASRLQDQNMEGDVIRISLRTSGLDWNGCEKKTDRKTNVSTDIMHQVESLFSLYDFTIPLRAAGIAVADLSPAGNTRQISLFENEEEHEKDRRTDLAINEIRSRYGFDAVRRTCTMLDRPLTGFNVKEDHTVHPVGYFQGRKMTL